MKKFTTKLTQIITGIAAGATLCAGKVMALSVQDGADAARVDGMPADLFGDTGVLSQVTEKVLLIVGVISVIMLIWGGIRYIISGGDSKKVTDAKNTVLYAIIGLIICLLAYAIVKFVINATLGTSY